MWTTHLKIVLRAILRHKGYAFINILGLALGLTCAVLMLLFVTFELSYDRYHANAERIFRVVYESQREGRTRASAYLPSPLPIKEAFAEIEETARLFTYSWMEQALVAYGDKSFFEDHFFLADPSIFTIFSFDVVRGDLRKAIEDPNSLVISQSAAVKFFGSDDPMGRILSVQNLRQSRLRVTAVIRDMPKNSHFQCDFIAPFSAGEDLFWDGFEERNSSHTYLLLRPGASPAALEVKFGAFLEKHIGEESRSARLALQALPTIHLHSHLNGEIEPPGDFGTVLLLASLAIIVLAVAAINFVNLATARSINRAREVGLKKVVGADRSSLVRQFMAEAVLFSFLALPAAIALVQVMLPAFNAILEADLSFDFAGNGRLYAGAVLMTFLLGVVSGIYPALIVSRFMPIAVLRGRFHLGGRGALLRRALVVFQNSATVILLIGAMVVFNQMRYIRDKDLGFDREPIVIIPVKDYESVRSYDLVRTAFEENSAVRSVTASQGIPSEFRSAHAVWFEGLPAGEDIEIAASTVDFGFLETYGIPLAEGRDFSRDFGTDEKQAYLINESAARAFGWAEPLGRKIQFSNRGLMRPEYEMGEVVGIVRDFHFRSLHEEIRPLVLKIHKERITHIAVRIAPGRTLLALDHLNSRWKNILPGRPLEFSFFDANVERLYRKDRKTGRVFAYAMALSIMIAALGVFGLASFSAAQRTKEVGIRKMLGASVRNIVWLLSKDFARLVILANALAWPLAYYFMNRWIRGFAYRAELPLWIFVFAAAFSFLVAFAAVGGRAVKTALANPVVSLRHE